MRWLLPLRLRVAIHALRGRPVAYRMTLVGPIRVDRRANWGVLIAECHINGRGSVPPTDVRALLGMEEA